jgi:hypothetical protein
MRVNNFLWQHYPHILSSFSDLFYFLSTNLDCYFYTPKSEKRQKEKGDWQRVADPPFLARRASSVLTVLLPPMVLQNPETDYCKTGKDYYGKDPHSSLPFAI